MLRLPVRAALAPLAAVALASGAAAAPSTPKRGPTHAAITPARPNRDAPVPPAVARAAGAICRPRFRVDGKPLEAGTAFTLRASPAPNARARAMLVTAHHLFGHSGGLDEEVPWAEMPDMVRAARCAAIQGRAVVNAHRALALSGAKAFDAGGPDVAAFLVADERVGPLLELASAPPRPGDRVWLVAQVVEGAPRRRLVHPATVVALEGDWLTYRLDDAGIQLRGTSGAPVVDRGGKVVGVNVAGGSKAGKVHGVAQSAASVRRTLGRCRSEECRAPGKAPRLEPPSRRR